MILPSSAFVIETILAASSVTFLLLGNVAAAARANDKYESHIQTVNLHILKTENEVAWIDTTLKINNYKSSSIDSDSEEGEVKSASNAHSCTECSSEARVAG